MARVFRPPSQKEVNRVLARASSVAEPTKRAELVSYVTEEVNRVAIGTIDARLDPVLAMAAHLGPRPWLDATRDDVIRLITTHTYKRGAHRARNPEELPERSLAPSSKSQWGCHLQTFYKHLLDTDDKPALCRRLPFKKVDSLAERGKELALGIEEFRQLFAAARTKRDRAILVVLYEGGYRVGEAAAIRLDGLDDRDHAIWIDLPADPHPGAALKTGRREVSVPVVAGKAVLEEWLHEHPLRERRRAELFVTQSARSSGRPMTGKTIGDVVKRCAKRAGLLGLHAHMLRHGSCTTKLSQGWPPEVVRQMHGWVPGSSQMAAYTWLAPHFESLVLQAHGLEPTKEQFLDILGAKACLACGEKMAFEKVQCPGCHIPAATAMQIADQRRREQAVLEYLAPRVAAVLGEPALASEPGAGVDFVRESYRKRTGKHPEGQALLDWCLNLVAGERAASA